MVKVMKKNNTFSEIKDIIDRSGDIVIISHILPDGDNIGSVLGMAISLSLLGKKVTPVVNGDLPGYYKFLPQSQLLKPPSEAVGQYDLVLALDMSDKARGGDALAFAFADNCPVVNIDHHISNDYFGDYNYVEPKAAATAQILTDFLLKANYPLNREIAASFYTGILTDSGNFTYTNTTADTLRLAGELLEYEPDLEEIRVNVFENISFKRKKILGQVLLNAVAIPEASLVYSVLTLAECRSLAAEGQDFEGIIDHLIGISDVKMAIFFREIEPDVVKVGFRGRFGVDVTVVAGAFGGGGHKAAAGCSLCGTLEDKVKAIVAAAIEYMENFE